MTKGRSKAPTKVPTQVSYRSSIKGTFVTKAFAEAHKRTTEREVIKHPER